MKSFSNLDREGQIKRSKHCAIGCVILALLIIGYVVYGNISVSHKESLCTRTTNGTITSVFLGSRYSYATVSAKFDVNGKTYTTSGRGFHSYSEIGNQIPVYYCADDPTIAYTGNGMSRPNTVVWCCVSFIFLAGTPLLLRQAKSIEKNGKIR